MVDVSVRVHEGEEAAYVSTLTELDRVIESAGEEARARDMLNIIFLDAPSGNTLSMVVGAGETVLSFTYGHLNPPYYASRGSANDPHPVMTCYVNLIHHTEFPRAYVIPFERGLIAAHEFADSGSLPSSVGWVET
jgi:hypothetical protein